MNRFKINTNRFITDTNRFITDGDPFIIDGDPFIIDGDPFIIDGDLFIIDGDLFIIDRDPFIIDGDPFIIDGDPFITSLVFRVLDCFCLNKCHFCSILMEIGGFIFLKKPENIEKWHVRTWELLAKNGKKEVLNEFMMKIR